MKKHSIQQPIFIPNQPSNFQKILKEFLNLLKAQATVNDSNVGYAVSSKKVYSVENLPRELKEKVLLQHHDININDIDWWAGLYRIWEEKLTHLGFEDSQIAFSGFYSQGDGASFTAKINLENYLKMHKLGNRYRAALLAAKANEVNFLNSRKSRH